MGNSQLSAIYGYFPELTERQKSRFALLYDLYAGWNAKINVISRRDMENLYLHHVLHSLGIVGMIRFKEGTSVMDVGTGGGFPGIPLAVYFPDVSFHLIDGVGKKVKVAQAIAEAVGLNNVTFSHVRAEDEKQLFDYVVSRAAMPLPDLVRVAGKNIQRKQQTNALPNGFICLKGGDFHCELLPFGRKALTFDLHTFFREEYFQTKKVIYIAL